MRKEVSETYSTHPCSKGYATCVAATRVHTQNPNTWKREAQKDLDCCVSMEQGVGWGNLLAEHPGAKSSAEVQKVSSGACHQL